MIPAARTSSMHAAPGLGRVMARAANRRVRLGARTPTRLLALVIAACASTPLITQAQVTPERLYYPISRPAPFVITRPEGATGDLRVELMRFGTEKPIATAPVEEGRVDLGTLFPTLWTAPSPEVLYAQLVAGETRVGPPAVLQPMVNPARAIIFDTELGKTYYVDPVTKLESFKPSRPTAEVLFQPSPAAYSGIRAWTDQHVVFDTTLGEIEFRLRPDHAPNTVRSFLDLVEGGFYQDIIFHRIVPKLPSGAPFVLQVGDPTGTGDGGPGFAIDLEPSRLPHTFGVLSMARDSQPDTNGSQVFIALSREGTQFLDGKYTSFGEAVAGADTILALAAVPVKANRPVDPPLLRSVKTRPAPPFGTGPEPVLPAKAAEPAGAR